MDLNTQTNWSARPQSNKKVASRSTLLSRPIISSQNIPETTFGAVRRTSGAHKSKQQPYIGKLTAAAAVVAGIIVWTTSSSETINPDTSVTVDAAASSNSGQSERSTVILAAATKAPAFFFGDSTDALKRSFLETEPETDDATHNSTAESALLAPTTEATIKASEALLAMASTPSTLNDLITPVSLSINNDDTAPSSGDTSDIKLFADPAPSKPITSDSAGQISAKTFNEKDTRKVSVTVASGDTLSAILNRNGLDAQDMNTLLTDDQVKKHLSNIDIGQVIDIEKNSAGQFSSLTTRAGDNVRVNVSNTIFGFEVSAIDLPIERQQQVVSGEIEQSLYLTAEQADLKQSTIMKLANIFQWELDFAREIRKGDKFSLVYDKLYREGEYIGDGDILAAEFVRGDKAYTAVYLTKEDGTSEYYSPEGESKKRTFMRHPVDVVRITSKFNPNRMHPVLLQTRAHRGVDYGSPHGSPIYATADGTVVESGPQGAYGNTVVLKHGQKFSTLYAHMSRISKKSIPGKRVNQGDVIGYVGKTGRVTGTHLHYEFRVNGEQIDPLKVDLPKSSPLEKKYHSQLADLTGQYVHLMTESLASIKDDPLRSVASGEEVSDTDHSEVAIAPSQTILD